MSERDEEEAKRVYVPGSDKPEDIPGGTWRAVRGSDPSKSHQTVSGWVLRRSRQGAARKTSFVVPSEVDEGGELSEDRPTEQEISAHEDERASARIEEEIESNPTPGIVLSQSKHDREG